MTGFPAAIVPVNHVEPSPRRIRGLIDGRTVVDTVDALYVWELSAFPQYYLPLADVDADVLVDDGRTEETPRGTAHLHSLKVGDTVREAAVKVFRESRVEGIAGHARVKWGAVDEWFEEDERIYVHPRSPYSRVDAIRSTRHLSVEVDGVVLADTRSPVMVFETGLTPRSYVNRTDVDLTRLVEIDEHSSCPYKGNTSQDWALAGSDGSGIAWSYEFPTRQLLPITGMVAFYNEKVDITLDGVRLERPAPPKL